MLRTYRPPTPETLHWVARQVHPRAQVSTVVQLTGGITADLDRISVESPTGAVDVLLRRWPETEPASDLVAREAAALDAMSGQPVPAPRLIASDEDGSRTGAPCTLTSALPGQPDLAPADLRSWLTQLASVQAAIHAVPFRVPARWHRWTENSRPLGWLTDRGLRDAAREAAEGPLTDDDVLVHGDYQPFNVLWLDGRLTGVVDWPNAATGNRGSDVGHCRLNLAVLFDAATAADYLTAYEAAAGTSVDRHADLQALLCFDLEWQEFVPHQVAGRAPLDVTGMPGRVVDAVRDALDGMG